ncbi:MAG: hypothetical protein GXP04_02365 [Alphaproteobacteria bacterium]|nr:hypothetical protein [Alphaproteobacteria bacterium]
MIALYPQVRTEEDLGDLRARAAWYFRSAMEAGERVTISVAADLNRVVEAPFYLETGADGIEPELMVTQTDDIARDGETVICWDKAARFAAPKALRRIMCAGDELCDLGASETWMKSAPITNDVALSRERFDRAVASCLFRTGPILVLGAGPSLSDAATNNGYPSNTINLYGGSSISNEEVIAARPPDFIAIADIAGQCGPSLTAKRYRDRLYRVLRDCPQANILVPEPCWRSLCAWWPADLKGRVIFLPETRLRAFGAGFSEIFAYQPTSNVLTAFLLPTAASMARDIYFAGIDGAASVDAKSGWSHDREDFHLAENLEAGLAHGRIQVSDLAGYYHQHWRRAASECAAIEKSGVSVYAPLAISKVEPDRYLSLKIRIRELARIFFMGVTMLETRPIFATVCSAVGAAILGGMIVTSSISVIFLFVLLSAALTGGYFSLRNRITRITAQQDRARASAEGRVLRSLAARLDRLEKGHKT